jgi:iron complex outermembrane receptor protein
MMLASGQAVAQTTAQPVPAPDAASSNSSSTDQNDIIVTASRRDESIIKVPSALSAYSDAKLRDENLFSLSDLTSRTPNIQISAFGNKANINIRGVGNGNLSQSGGEPGVAISSDGVYLGQTSLALTSLLDLNRVEILRGPQGTLFGRNATGGAVNLIPNLPTAQPAVGLEVTAGLDPATVRTAAYLSGPITANGALMGRVSVVQNYNEGFTRNLSNSGPQRLDGLNNFAVRGQLLWRASSDFDVRLLVEHQRIDDNGAANFLLGNPTNTPYVTPFGPAPIQGADPGDPEARRIRLNYGARKLNSTNVDLTANLQIGGGTLKALVSYAEGRQDSKYDADGTEVDFVSTRSIDKSHQFFGELTYSSDSSAAFTYVLGANYFDEHLESRVIVPQSQLTALFGPTFAFTSGGTVDSRSFAVFGRAQYQFGRLKVFGGLRYSNDHKAVPNQFATFAATGGNGSASFSRVTYEAGASYDFAPTVTGYAKYATGYKSGGFVLGVFAPPFRPETNTNIEAGLKGRFFNGALQANLSAFHMKYSDLQVNQILFLTVGVTNAAQATVDGVELETVFRPVERVRLEANAAWLNARFNSFLTQDASRPAGPGCTITPGTTNCVYDLAGNRLPNAPKYSASLAAYYDAPIGSGTLTPSVRYNWKSQIFFTEFNIPISAQKSVGKVDLMLNYKSGSGRWTGSLFATNVTNEQVRSNVTVVSTAVASIALAKYQPGRQVGLSLGYHF